MERYEQFKFQAVHIGWVLFKFIADLSFEMMKYAWPFCIVTGIVFYNFGYINLYMAVRLVAVGIILQTVYVLHFARRIFD